MATLICFQKKEKREKGGDIVAVSTEVRVGGPNKATAKRVVLFDYNVFSTEEPFQDFL
jgi:hypothetical protein